MHIISVELSIFYLDPVNSVFLSLMGLSLLKLLNLHFFILRVYDECFSIFKSHLLVMSLFGARTIYVSISGFSCLGIYNPSNLRIGKK